MRRLGWALVAVACGPLVEVGETGDSSGDGTTSTTTTTSASTSTSTSTTTAMSTSATTAVPDTSASDTDAPPPPGSFCQAACEVAMDCCQAYANDDDCMGMFGTYPWNLLCEDGTCTFGGCASDEDCTFGGVLEGYGCRPNADGIGVCQPLCSQDADCDALFLTGWICNPDGYCEPAPCKDDQSCGPGLVCSTVTGQCVADCESQGCAGFGECEPGTGQCVCTDSNECPEGYRCSP